jgi:CRP-like cAMP-binding protein
MEPFSTEPNRLSSASTSPLEGVVSVVVGFGNGRFVEAGIFGRNTVIGGGAALGNPLSINQTISRVGGSGAAAEVHAVRRLAAQSETLRDCFVHHEQMASVYLQQLAACNALHSLDKRLICCLLQTRDLIGSDELPLTHETLSQMLGVRRSSVTVMARALQTTGQIRYRHGRIKLLDIEALLSSCCEC